MNLTVPGSYENITTKLRDEFQKGIDDVQSISMPIVDTIQSSGKGELHNWLEFVPGLREWTNNDLRVIRNVQTKEYYVANRRFENTIEIDVDDAEDNALNQYSYVAKGMGREAELLADQLVAELFNNGFASQTTYDGEYWFSNSHSVGLSTVDNLYTDALSQTSFIAAYHAIRSFTIQPDAESTARPLNPMGKYVLMVPTELEVTAREIVELDYASSGASNKTKGLAEVMVNPWLTDANNWFLMNTSTFKPVMYQERLAPSFIEKTPANSDGCFYGDKIQYGIKARGAALPTFPWLCVGSLVS